MCLTYFYPLLFNIFIFYLIYLSIYIFYPKYFVNDNIQMNLLDNLVYIKSEISDKSINNTINEIKMHLKHNSYINI